MSVEREAAVVNNQIILRNSFRYSQTSDLFDPSEVRQVVILDSDQTTVIETIASGSITQDSTGKYHVTAAAISSAKTIYDKWYFTPASGAAEITKTNTCIVWATNPSGLTGYCSKTNIEAYFMNKSFGASDYVTETEVETFIGQIAAMMDAKISSRYSLPITNAYDLLILKMINEYLVVAIIDDIFREKTEDGKFDRGRNTRKEGNDLLNKIVNGEMILNSTHKRSVIKFNSVDGNGDTVNKRFKDSYIEPTVTYVDRERRTVTSS